MEFVWKEEIKKNGEFGINFIGLTIMEWREAFARPTKRDVFSTSKKA